MTADVKASLSLEEMRELAARICRDYLNGAWKNISSEDIHLKRISGGLSNFLYYVSLPEKCDNNNESPNRLQKSTFKRLRKDSVNNILEPKEVLLRIYGQTHGDDALETMLTESVVFTLLSERNLGPKLHGIFPGGRIEQYIPARSLSTAELFDSKISMKIAGKMAEIHSLNIPVSKEPDWLWKTIGRWLKTAKKVLSNIDTPTERKYKNTIDEIKKFDFEKEVAWLKSIILCADFPVVFCHNDLQEGNILLKEDISRRNSIDTLSNDFEDSSILDTNFNNDFEKNTKPADKTALTNFVNGNCRKRSLGSDEEEAYIDFDCTRDSVLSGNSDTCDPDLIIIDYEYCAYNYRGFDIANHFLEWTFEYTNEKCPYFFHKKEQYPSRKQQINFISEYLTKYSEDEDYVPSQDDITELLHEEYAISRLREFGLSKIAYKKSDIGK